MSLTPERAGLSMALVAMVSVQLGLAVSIGLIDELGTTGAAWLRLSWAAALFLLIVRPRPSTYSREALTAGVALGVVTGSVTLLFMAAVERIPLGMASALEFLGPLGVAVARSKGAGRIWAVVAAGGVLCLTQPWGGTADPVGVAFALAAAFCWAAYIVLTQRLGDSAEGISGLAVSMPVAALLATGVAGPGVVGDLTPELLAIGAGLALLLPVVPFTLEMLALQRLSTGAFGTFMALEPGIALLIGFVALHQAPNPLAITGIGLVIAAGIGAERSGTGRPATARVEPPAHVSAPG